MKKTVAKGSYRHHEWRLSTPCVDFTSPVKNGIYVHEFASRAKHCFFLPLMFSQMRRGLSKQNIFF
ncbi:MAG: hypothetical protein H6R25_3097 [Proteobacteria bacterium]|nr:hypothetical protein [Pseudomonadota bacterium]